MSSFVLCCVLEVDSMIRMRSHYNYIVNCDNIQHNSSEFQFITYTIYFGQAGTAYTERHHQIAGIVFRNICTVCGIDPPKTRWEFPEKIVKNKRARILQDFRIQRSRQILINQPNIVVKDENQKSGIDRYSGAK